MTKKILEEVNSMNTKFNEWYQDYQTINNKLPTDADIDKQIDDLTMSVPTDISVFQC